LPFFFSDKDTIDELLKIAAEQAAEKASEILASSENVKGKTFTDKARIVLIGSQLEEMVQHNAVCRDPACGKNTVRMANTLFIRLLGICLDGMSDSDADEFTNLCVALRSAVHVTPPAKRN